MNVVVIGGGGREHALVWHLLQSDLVSALFCIPGNAGTAAEEYAENVPGNIGRVELIAETVASLSAGLVVVGPEQPLVHGLVNRLDGLGITVVGPTKSGARLEGSKAFAKKLMEKAGVPTADFRVCRSFDLVEEAIDDLGTDTPVIKVDGLAGGKGVTVCDSRAQALEAASQALEANAFGEAGKKILVEERLVGIEASYIVLTDGTNYIPLPSSQDHKRLLDGDVGPLTGGMGAYTPAGFLDAKLDKQIRTSIVEPTLEAARALDLGLRGFLYVGLMLTDDGPKVLEFNVRLGDPEAQSVLFGLDEDIVPALVAAAKGELPAREPFKASPAATVVLAAAEYPKSGLYGRPIEGLEEAGQMANVKVFHGATGVRKGKVRTTGGRVLGVTARGDTAEAALARAYEAVECIKFEGMQYRRDIGKQITSS
jgi:phosphoribosylamine--glycine ligase